MSGHFEFLRSGQSRLPARCTLRIGRTCHKGVKNQSPLTKAFWFRDSCQRSRPIQISFYSSGAPERAGGRAANGYYAQLENFETRQDVVMTDNSGLMFSTKDTSSTKAYSKSRWRLTPIYQVESDNIRIIAVAHQRRRPSLLGGTEVNRVRVNHRRPTNGSRGRAERQSLALPAPSPRAP